MIELHEGIDFEAGLFKGDYIDDIWIKNSGGFVRILSNPEVRDLDTTRWLRLSDSALASLLVELANTKRMIKVKIVSDVLIEQVDVRDKRQKK